MKKTWLKMIATVAAIFIASTVHDSVFAASKTAIEQTNYEDYYFGAAIICFILAIFTFFFRAKKYKRQYKL
ncbi:MAG: hypothetical protein KBT36_13085 [Kurthia sp.]|nr:hypothetical protein [Candidatus Kurthia equi]